MIDPFAVIPLYLAIVDGNDASEKKLICRKAILFATIILILFALFGLSIFKFFGITLPAFQIAGGILLLLLGISQLKAERKRVRPEEQGETSEVEDSSVFPLATPILAGPGAISTVVLVSGSLQSRVDTVLLVISIIVVMLVTYNALKFAPVLLRVLGRTGLSLLTRLMGVVLTAIAIQFLINGITEIAITIAQKIP